MAELDLNSVLDFLPKRSKDKLLPYSRGRVSIQSGSPKLRGKGTNWSQVAKGGQPLVVTGGKLLIGDATEVYGIESVDNDGEITLTKPYNGPEVERATYVYFEGTLPETSPISATADTARTIFYALLIALFIRAFFFQPFNIPSGSMISTLLIGDYLFVSKYAYGYSRHSLPFSPNLFSGRIFAGAPERGDVVVFKTPADGRTDFIKRVVGLPGDRIQMVDGVLHINGSAVKRERIGEYLDRDRHGNVRRHTQYRETLPNGVSHNTLDSTPAGLLDDTQEFRVPEGHYFMMGDNRDNSSDSRRINDVGYVPAENLVGRAEILFFSTDGSARFWEIWNWPSATRFERIISAIE